ncbi:MAG TPA: hypothetical protein PLI19_07150, partial [Erysipelotrichaceae bacterium]|nr:hypothetical protein [Erysipelotrichaceae bacterium]
KIMVINKNPKNRVRYPEKSFPEICRDIPGGHCIYSAIPEDELQSGKISEETVRSQAFKEFSEEVVFTKDQKVAFRERDFKFVGFYPYDGPDNRELSALFTLAIPFYDGELQTQDNVGDVICSLPNEAISYQQLSDEWQNRHENKEALRFEDGLGRLMMKGDLLKQIEKVQL